RRSYPCFWEPLIRGGDSAGYRRVLVGTSDAQSRLCLQYARGSDSNVVGLSERFANQRLQLRILEDSPPLLVSQGLRCRRGRLRSTERIGNLHGRALVLGT